MTAVREKAVLVGVQLPGTSDEDHAADFAELTRLAHTLGFDVVGTVSQRRDALSPAAVLGEGKLRDLAKYTGGTGVVPSGAPVKKQKKDPPGRDTHEGESDGADAPPAESHAKYVLVDHEITPSQARNLERATGALVLDRTGVIVDIFHRHARSREARLQVEIARLTYVAPRLREAGGASERQRGKGSGETALELDKRRIRDRIAELREELAAIEREQRGRRALREGQRRVALVGYTNAGKSSLMRALTGSEVLVADQLFATLDTTVRAIHPEAKPRILVSDTVGFIKKLPHDLVASFRSTLDEALEAGLLLYVADASSPTFRAQLQVTRDVLREIRAQDVPSRLLLNKVDRLSDAQRAALQREYPDATLLSARLPADVAALREAVVTYFDAQLEEGEIFVPYSQQAKLGEVYEGARVVAEDYGDEGARLVVRAPRKTLAWLKTLFD